MQIHGILGKKIGMSQIFKEDGSCLPVTFIEAGPCVVLKSYAKGKIHKIQLGLDVLPASKQKQIKKPQLGMFAKLNISPQRIIKEVCFSSENAPAVGSSVNVGIFKEGEFVDITGNSIGKGFAGGMKRWNWTGGYKTHGSTSHRRIGSVGSNTDPGRVFRGHHMPGHLGNRKVTIQAVEVVSVKPEQNLLIVKGSVVGSDNNFLVIQKSKRKEAAAKKVVTPAAPPKEAAGKVKESKKQK
ncbi:MAG: 50S ribosomal protein L3 [Candidatus Omnitrophota bacterium]